MADQKLAKSLPKRANTSHPKHAKRMGHKARAKAKKAARNAANLERHARNVERKANGELTPWELAKAARRSRRCK